MKASTSMKFRVIHRYLGFFLAGIMAMYSISGITMIFRNTDYLKVDVPQHAELAENLTDEEIGQQLRMRDFKADKVEGDIVYFSTGTYNRSTGVAEYSRKELPYVLDKMTKFHKATTDSPVYWLNIFFGVSLLFFVLSAFWMFMPGTSVFKKGLYFTLAGVILTLILIFV